MINEFRNYSRKTIESEVKNSFLLRLMSIIISIVLGRPNTIFTREMFYHVYTFQFRNLSDMKIWNVGDH